MAFKKRQRFDNVSPFKFEKKGDSLSGYYIKSDTITINGSDVPRHLFQTADGLVGVLGQHNLGKQLAEEAPGVMIRATLAGIQKLGGNKTLKVYDLEVDADDVLTDDEAQAVAADAQGEDHSDDSEPEESEDEAPADEVPPARAKPPVQAAKAPDAARKAQVQALLNKGRAKAT